MRGDAAGRLRKVDFVGPSPLPYLGDQPEIVRVGPAMVPYGAAQGPLEALLVAGAEGLLEDFLGGSLEGHEAGTLLDVKKTVYASFSQTFRKLRKMS